MLENPCTISMNTSFEKIAKNFQNPLAFFCGVWYNKMYYEKKRRGITIIWRKDRGFLVNINKCSPKRRLKYQVPTANS